MPKGVSKNISEYLGLFRLTDFRRAASNSPYSSTPSLITFSMSSAWRKNLNAEFASMTLPTLPNRERSVADWVMTLKLPECFRAFR